MVPLKNRFSRTLACLRASRVTVARESGCARTRATGKRATIKDIAERAGVSKGAVSYALNGRPGVSDETRARILAIADELGLVPEPRRARPLGLARRRLRARPCATGDDDRARAVLHGVHRRSRGAALAALDRPDAPARRLRRGGDRGLPALVRRASRRRRVRRRPPARRPAGRRRSTRWACRRS